MQLIEEKTAGQPEVSVYTIKDKDTFVDFCVGPHVPSTGKLKAFKLTTTSNAYWKGDAKNAPMQRVYGTAFFSQKELDEHLTRIEEAKKRDHRKLGKELGLFAFHPWAPGAGFWTGKGATLYNTLADYMRGRLVPAGYQEVKTPIVYNKELWITSGHWSHYRENMFLVESADGDEMGLKAMNCPGHYLLYGTEKHSYREMPIRYHEQTPLHRNEASGVLAGLTRVRQFSQDDGHCFLMESQISSRGRSPDAPDSGHLRRLRPRVHGQAVDASGEVHRRDCAVGPRRRRARRRRSSKAGQAYTINAGDGAFYGPKIDFDITDALGRKWQCGTIQLDYVAPERFDLTYVGADNAEHRPVVIHRAIFGSFERFIAILIEHFAGAFPLWLAPVQAIVLPIADRHLDYAQEVTAALSRAGLKAEVDDRQEKVNLQDSRGPAPEDPLHAGGRGSGGRRPRGRGAQPREGRPGGPAAGHVRDRRACRGRLKQLS